MTIDLVSLEKGLRVEFNKAMSGVLSGNAYAQLFDAAATVVPSTNNNEKYGFLGDVPVVKEWIGDKTYGALEDYDYTITNKDWYSGIAIDRNEIEDDNLGAIPARIQTLVAALRRYQGQLIANLLVNGTTGTAYDSSAMYANRTAPNDNLLSGTGITLATIAADIASMRAAMMKFQSDTGEVLGILLDTIIVPPELEYVMRQAVTSTVDPALTGNANANPINSWIKNIIVLPNASDATDWYGACTTFPLRPFIFQNRKDPTPVLDEGSVKRNRTLEYSAEMRCNAGYGLPQLTAKMVNTG